MATTGFNGIAGFCGQHAFQNSDGTGTQTVLSSGSATIFAKSILVTSTDTVDQKLRIWYVHGANSFLLGSVDVPAGQGTAGTPPVDALGTGNISNGQGFALTPGDSLSAAVESAVSSTKFVYVVALGLI